MSRKILLCALFLLVLSLAASAAGPSWPFPDLNQLKGWKPVGDPATYTRDTLYEYIDGDAETFFAYGFEKLAVAKYANAGAKLTITLDLYDMAGPLAAFGVYANGRSAEVEVADVGAQGYYGEDALDFWKGRYYVRVIADGEAAGLKETLLSFGRCVAAGISGEAADPPETQLLPREGQVKNTLQYQPQNVLGQGFLSNAFMAEYERGGAKSQLVVARCKSDAEAQKALSALRDYVKGSGTLSEAVPAPNSFFGNNPYYKNILATVKGPFVVCVLRAPDCASAQALADRVGGKLPGR